MIKHPREADRDGASPPPADLLAERPGSDRGQNERSGEGKCDGVGERQVLQSRDEEEHRGDERHGPQQLSQPVRHPQGVQTAAPVHQQCDRD